MTTKLALYFISLLLFISTIINAEVVKFNSQCTPSSTSSPGKNHTKECTISEVRIAPCKEAENGKPCRLKRGLNVTIQFDFTPHFNAEKLSQKAYWTNQIADLPFVGLNPDGCLGVKCPLVSGQKYFYDFHIYIDKAYPARQFDVKWRLRNEEEKECCFVYKIKITP